MIIKNHSSTDYRVGHVSPASPASPGLPDWVRELVVKASVPVPKSVAEGDPPDLIESDALASLDGLPAVTADEALEEALTVRDVPLGTVEPVDQRPNRDGLTAEPNDNGSLAWDTAIEPEWCPACRGIDAWWDFSGARHCARCDPPNRSNLVEERAKLLRQRATRRIFTKS